jgi:hypothetical protein
METAAINPIAETMLLVNAGERLEKRFAAHSVSAKKHHLAVDGSRYWPAEGLFEDINHRFLIFICAGPRQHSQLPQDIILPVTQ